MKIQRSSNGQVTYMLSGQIGEEDTAELEALIRSEAKRRRMVFSSEREVVSPIREQELIAWALIIVILVISVIAFYLLWANGTV